MPPLKVVRVSYSPHAAGLLRKNFSPPQSVRYVIGSLPAELPAANWYSCSRPKLCAVSCAIVQHASYMRVSPLPDSWFANENEITLSSGAQVARPTPRMSIGRPTSDGIPAAMPIVYDTPIEGGTSLTVTA